MELLGCDIEFFKSYLQSKFLPGMTWENYGVYDENRATWQLDHIIPCASFNLLEENEQRKCFHYLNYQPLWTLDNIEKSNKINGVRTSFKPKV